MIQKWYTSVYRALTSPIKIDGTSDLRFGSDTLNGRDALGAAV